MANRKERMGRLPRDGHETSRDHTGIGGTAKGRQTAIGTSGENVVEGVEGDDRSGPRGNTALHIDGVYEIHAPRPNRMAVGRPRTLACEMGEFNGSSGAIQSRAPLLANRRLYSLEIGIRLDGVLRNRGTPRPARQGEQVLRPNRQQRYPLLLGAKKGRNGRQISETKDNPFGFYSHRSDF